MKNVIKLAKGSLNNFFQDLFNKILSQQLTHDRSYISPARRHGKHAYLSSLSKKWNYFPKR